MRTPLRVRLERTKLFFKDVSLSLPQILKCPYARRTWSEENPEDKVSYCIRFFEHQWNNSSKRCSYLKDPSVLVDRDKFSKFGKDNYLRCGKCK